MSMDDRKRFVPEMTLDVGTGRTHLVFSDRLNPGGHGRTCSGDHPAS